MKQAWIAALTVVLSCSGTETGNPGTRGIVCSADADCLDAAQRAAAAAAAPVTPPTFVSSVCLGTPPPDGGATPSGSCECGDGAGSRLTITPDARGCTVYGRARDCLFAASEFGGCDPGAATSCDATCSRIQALLDADAARSLDVRVHAGVCADGQCRSILSIDGRCFVGDSRIAHDCSLTDGEILSREAQGIP